MDAPRMSTAAPPPAPRRVGRWGFSLAVLAIGGALIAESWVPTRPGVLSAASEISTAIMASGRQDSPGPRAPTHVPKEEPVPPENAVTFRTAEAALDAAATELRACVKHSGTALPVEYSIPEQADRFAAARPLVRAPSVQTCLDRVIAPLRFTAGPTRTLSVEHTP
jgi:hypothetical protein